MAPGLTARSTNVVRAINKAMVLFAVCDCPRPARTSNGAELAEWEPALDYLPPVPEGYGVEYIQIWARRLRLDRGDLRGGLIRAEARRAAAPA